jgi:methionyl-tRNA formyltransferase
MPMLRVIFIGREMMILKELQQCSEVCGVYVQKQKVRPWKLREVLLKNNKLRQMFRPILRKFCLKKWLRTLESYTIHDYVKENRIPLLSASKINDKRLLELIKELNPDLGVVANFGQKVPKTVLQSATYGFINFHPSLLPKYRGPNPIQQALLNSETETGVTWHRMEEALDRGNILSQDKISVLPTDNERDLILRSLETGKKMLGPLLRSLEQGTCKETSQDESEATYCSRLTREERKDLDRILSQRAALKKAANHSPVKDGQSF